MKKADGGGDDEIEPDDPAEGEAEVARFEALLGLYPLDRASEITKAYFEALPPNDGVFLPETSAEELEAEMADAFALPDDASDEDRAEVEQMKQGFRQIRGKKVSEIETTPEEDAQFYAEEALTGLRQLFSGWAQTLYLWEKQEGAGARLTDTFEPTGPIRAFGGKTWQEIAGTPTPFTADEIAELHAVFAAKLRAAIDADPTFRLASDWTIKKDAQGYHLVP